MTAPKPEAMSPREKVAVIVEAAILRHFPGTVVSDTLDDASDIITALASSGDHADLARLAEACGSETWQEADGYYPELSDIVKPDGGNAAENCFPNEAAFIATANPAAILALIAEVAALRSELDQARSLHHRATDRSRHWEIAAIRADNQSTEAERKLAEAEGLLVELADAPQPKDTGTRFFRAMSSINSYVARMNARTFLSKEAERG